MTTRHAVRSILSVLVLLLVAQFATTAQTVKPFVTVDAARYQPAVAPDSIVSGFTVAITTQSYLATEDVDSVTPGIQLPTSLGGLRVLVNNRLAELLYVGPNQINYIVPAATEVDATATVVVTDEQGTTLAQGELYMAASSLNIFTQNQQGTGSPAAAFTADGITYTQVNNGDGSTNNVPPGNFLILFGTGVRDGKDVKAFIGGIEAQVDYAGAQPSYVALDQINIRIPEAVTGQGLLDVVITDGLTISNSVSINVGGNPEAPAAAPVITSFNATEAIAGQIVTVTGTQFPATLSEASVKLGSTPGQVVSTNATSLTFIVPYGAATDKVTIGNTSGTRKSTASLSIKTSISGTVLDGNGAPLSGITVSVPNANLAASTDSTGRFLLTDVPRGLAQVEIDTSLLPANLGLPTMTYSMVVTAGRDNEIGFPIYLPAGLGTTTFLNNVRWPNSLTGGLVAQPEADPVVIEHDGLKLEIPSTVTFPKGAREPRLGLTRLSADGRLPAPLPSKVYPSVVALITPVGTTFGAKGEGLATLTFPNPDRFAAGTVLDLYAFRPNVAPSSFVKKGTATVNSAGDKIVASSLIDFATIWFIGVPIDQVTFTNVVGQVVDSNDKPVARARVFVRGRSAVTDQNGKFEIKGVRAKNDDELRVDAMFFTPAGNGLRTFKLVKAVVPGTTDAGIIKLPAPPPLSVLIRPMEAKIRPGATLDMTLVLSRKFSAPATFNLVNEEGVKLDLTPATLTLEAGQMEATFKVKGDVAGRGTVVAKLAAAVEDATPDNTRKGFAIVYVLNPTPVLDAITPPSGAPGSTFTLVGKGFGSEAQQHQVHFKQGDIIRPVDARTLRLTPGTDGNASLTGIVPGLRTGEVEVFISVMRNGVLSEPSNKLKFTVTATPAPKLEALTPTSGTPGATFTLAGTGLDPNPKNNGIFFKLGDRIIPSPVELLKVLTTSEADGSVRIQGIVPRMPSGDAEVFAVVYRNGAPSEPSNKLAFKVLAPEGAKLETIDPKEGAPREVFTIKGSGFDPDAKRNFVFFKKGDRFIQLDPATLRSDGKTFISGVVPRMMPGDYEVFVVTNLDSVPATAGKLPGTPSNALPFKLLPPPAAKLEAIDPVEGKPGVAFTLKGSGWGEDARLFRVVFKQGERFIMLEPGSIRFDARTITGKVPNVAPGDYDVLVVTHLDIVTAAAPALPGVLSNALRFKVLGDTVTPPTGAPELISISPTEGKPGELFKLTGKNFSNDITVTFMVGDIQHIMNGGLRLKITETTIEAALPALPPGAGKVWVHNALGKSNELPFKFIAPDKPMLESITPGEGAPGTKFTIKGLKLRPFYEVFFKKGGKVVCVPHNQVQGDETMTMGIVPGLTPGDAEVFIGYVGGVPLSDPLPFKVLPIGNPAKLVAIEFTPRAEAVGSPMIFKLTGENLAPFYNVVFRRGERVGVMMPDAYRFENGAIMGQVPDFTPGEVEVFLALEDPTPFSNILKFTVPDNPPPPAKPELLAITPTEGMPGATFKLTGKNFATGMGVSFKMGTARVGIPADKLRISATEIEGVLPLLPGGRAEVAVLYGNNLSSNALPFQFLPLPGAKLDSVDPVEGKPGTVFSLKGSGFGDDPKLFRVVFKQGERAVILDPTNVRTDGAKIDAQVPNVAAGEYEIIVFTRLDLPSVELNGLPPGVPSNALRFKVLGDTITPPTGAPELISISPTEGKPGELFKLTGKNFTNDMSVMFMVGTIQHVMSGSRLTITATTIEGELPALPPGEGKVWAQNTKGQSNALPFKFIAPDKPTLESIDPKEGVPGTKFTLKGLKFRKFYELFFKKGDRVICVPHNQIQGEETMVMGIVPGVEPGDYEVFIGFVGGVPFSNPLPFKVLPLPNTPKLVAIDPVEGKAGTPFKLTGEHVGPFFNIVFKQGDKRSEINPDGYRFENGMFAGAAPRMAPGEAEVFLAFEGGAPLSNILKFKFLGDTTTPPVKPELESINPTEGAPGTPFKLTGKNFIDGQTVYFRQGSSDRAVPKESLKFTATTIEGVVPALPPGAAEVFVSFVNSAGGNETSNKLPFKFTLPANIAKLDAINPTEVRPGGQFKLTGSNLAPYYEVVFKQSDKYIEAPRQFLKFTDGTMIEGTVPGLAPGDVQVFVGYGNGIDHVASNPLPVKVLAAPEVALEAISSLDGKPEGAPGKEFKLTGRNLAPFYNIVFKQGEKFVRIPAFSYRIVDGAIVWVLPELPAGVTEVYLALGADGPAVSNVLRFTFLPKS